MFRHIFLFIIIFLFPLSLLPGLEAGLSAIISDGHIIVRARALSVDSEKILASLEEGFRAEIVFQFRIYNRNRGFFSFLGDWLVAERKISFIAFKDFFLGQYGIREENRKPVYFGSAADFFAGFSSVADFELVGTNSPDTGDYYVLARVSVNPVKLEPPLHIITLFSSIERTSAWKEFSFPKKGAQR